MSKASTSCFKVTLLVAIVCFAVVAGHADTIPELTGTFNVFGSDNFGNPRVNMVNLISPIGVPFAGMTFSPPANLPFTTITNCSTYGCVFVTLWDGSAFGGAVGMGADVGGGQFITMTGGMTGGVISGLQEECTGNLICYADEWQFDFTFRGIWSNGWWSEGSSSIHISTNPPGETFGSVAMTTFATPEPGTIALLSTGIVCGWRSWRRRNRILV